MWSSMRFRAAPTCPTSVRGSVSGSETGSLRERYGSSQTVGAVGKTTSLRQAGEVTEPLVVGVVISLVTPATEGLWCLTAFTGGEPLSERTAGQSDTRSPF